MQESARADHELKQVQRAHEAAQIQMEALRTATQLALKERDEQKELVDTVSKKLRSAQDAYVSAFMLRMLMMTIVILP